VTYDAGIGDDPTGLRGLAHLTEHLVAAHSRHVPSALGALESWGASTVNAETSLDATSYFETVPPERLEDVLWLESDRMGFAADAVTAERVAVARAAVTNEGRQREWDANGGALWLRIHPELFPVGHPYANASGWHDADAVKPADVRAFLATWYAPSNATVAIAGHFDRDATLAMARRYFGSLPSRPAPERPSLPAPQGPSVRLAFRAAVRESEVLIAWVTPAYGAKEDAALDLVAMTLAGPGNERFARSLVAPGWATWASAQQESARGFSTFCVRVGVPIGVDPQQVLPRVLQTVDEVAQGVAPSEAARARESERLRTLEALEAPWVRAGRLASLAKAAVFPGVGFDWGTARYEALDEHDVKAAAETWLAKGRHVVALVFKDKSAPIQGELTDRTELAREEPSR
jgi:zinc protease